MALFLALLAAAYVAGGILLWSIQEALIYPGLWMPPAGGLSERWGEQVTLEGKRKAEVRVLRTPPRHDRVVLLTHGNGETAAQMGDYGRVLDAAGWDLVVMEYRGYDGVAGWPTERSLSTDLAVVYESLAGTYGEERIVLHGRSIGGGVICTLLDGAAAPAGVVLESSFDSLSAVASATFPAKLYPTRLLLRSVYDTKRRLAGREIPVFQAHDVTDSIVPVARARSLASALQQVQSHETSGYPHGMPLVLDPLRNDWLDWLDQTVAKTAKGGDFGREEPAVAPPQSREN